MKRKTIVIAIGALLLLAAGAAWAVFFRAQEGGVPERSPEEERIMAAIDEANHCETTEDCAQAAASVCPFGCYVHVHKDEVERIATMLVEYQTSRTGGGSVCMYSCIEYPGVECASGKCLLKEPK